MQWKFIFNPYEGDFDLYAFVGSQGTPTSNLSWWDSPVSLWNDPTVTWDNA